MKLYLATFFLFLSLTGWSQKAIDCATGKAALFQSKSASLSRSQIRLTEKYDVTHYFLDLEMTNLSTQISGKVSMTARAKQPMDTLLFELFESLEISEIQLNGNPVAYSRNGSAIIIPVNFPAGNFFTVKTTYSGTPPTAATNPLGGSGMTNASSPTWSNQVTWSLSQPYSAYEWWPCKQSLRDKIDSVDIHITVPSNCKAGSNGKLMRTVVLGNGQTRFEWKHKHKIDYYLISVSVARYIEYNVFAHPAGSSDSIQIQNFIYDNPQTLPFFKEDIDETAAFLELFAELYGPYPFPNEKYGHCMAPLGGGMEHQTMTTQGSFNKTLTAHELAHQWFGDHVTCASWADIWVNEGFARYSEILMLERLYPGEDLTSMNTYHTNIMSSNGGAVWVADSLNGTRLFSSRLTYNKGAAILHTFRYLVKNDTVFFRAMRKYQTRFADSTAIGLDFQRVLEEESGLDFSAAFEQWYFGEGYPTYTARWNNVNGALHLRISHTASMASVTPTFTTPLEIQFKRTGMADTTIRFSITGNTTNIIVPGMGNVASIFAIDPKNAIINKTGSTAKDNNLIITSVAQEISVGSDIQIFPNPASEKLHIKVEKAGYWTGILLDGKGRKFGTQVFSGSVDWDIHELPSGVYHLQLTTPNGTRKVNKVIRK